MSLPNFLSILRIILVIPILVFLEQKTFLYYYLALVFFVIASLTDFLDGYLARKNNQSSSLGALLDLLADKLLVTLVLLWLLKLYPTLSFAIPVAIIVARELVISTIRQFIAENRNLFSLKAEFLGKSKTLLQLIAISCLIVSPNLSNNFFIFSLTLFWISSALSLYSLLNYLKRWKLF